MVARPLLMQGLLLLLLLQETTNRACTASAQSMRLLASPAASAGRSIHLKRLKNGCQWLLPSLVFPAFVQWSRKGGRGGKMRLFAKSMQARVALVCVRLKDSEWRCRPQPYAAAV